MYQWKTLRLLAGLLLFLPLGHLAYMLAQDLATYLDPSPTVWNKEMVSLIEADLDTALPQRPILITGGQRVRLWRDLPDRLRPIPALMRPLGDATLEDLTHHYDRLIGYYRPEILVLLPSYGDLHLRDYKNPLEFEDSLSALLELDEAYGSSTWRYVFAPLQMPLHPEDRGRIRTMGELAQRLAMRLANLTVIDANPLLSAGDGAPDPQYYQVDGVNLNDEGYARLSILLETELRKNMRLENRFLPTD